MNNLTKAIDQLLEVVKDLKEIYSASITIPNDGNVIQVQSSESELLEEARRRYQVGMIVKTWHPWKIITIEKFIYDEQEEQVEMYGKTINLESGNTCNEGCLIVLRENKWAEIIAEEKELSDEEKFMAEKGEQLSKTKLTVAPEKSLHDQIREGGWEKVIELVGRNYNYCCGTDECGTKVDAYIKLLALSKVLNEGKERGDSIYTVYANLEWKIKKVEYLYGNPAIGFYTDEDITFALEFAEKEWKIFYNAKE